MEFVMLTKNTWKNAERKSIVLEKSVLQNQNIWNTDINIFTENK